MPLGFSQKECGGKKSWESSSHPPLASLDLVRATAQLAAGLHPPSQGSNLLASSPVVSAQSRWGDAQRSPTPGPMLGKNSADTPLLAEDHRGRAWQLR